MNGDISSDSSQQSPNNKSESPVMEKPEEPELPEDDGGDEWQVARQGIVMWLKDPLKAESFLQQRLDSVHVLTSFTFVSCINGVISYELDKMQTAQRMLKDLEQRCSNSSSNGSWLRSLRSMIFGRETESQQQTNSRPLVDRLEEQIILADTQLCSAILTFLTQDISGMMRGSWLLKRAWKIYQNVYQQIFTLYKESLHEEDTEALKMLPYLNPKLPLCHSSSNGTVVSSSSTSDWSLASQETDTNSSSSTSRRRGLVQSVSDYFLATSTSPASTSDENKKSRRKSKKNKIPRSKSTLENKSTTKAYQDPPIDPSVLHRLMGAISFGYGVFQLSVSLLPPSMLKLVSFFGFEGDRPMGLSCLKFSRTTKDMRAPLATIALLWYWTMGQQIFAGGEQEDLSAEIAEVEEILKDSETEFSDSSLFVFFKGRVQRMHKNMPLAIQHFERAYYTSCLPELRLLCLHEIGWCRLLQLDCLNAIEEFHALRVNSDFSKGFFVYLTMLCHGVAGRKEDLLLLRRETVESVANSPQKDSQIDLFIGKRVEIIPEDEEGMEKVTETFWRFLVYELLFLWNTLDQASEETLTRIFADCESVEKTKVTQRGTLEPFLGLSKLLLGAAQTLRKRTREAITAYRECLVERETTATNGEEGGEKDQKFAHISAFASYKLATLLLAEGGGRQRMEAQDLLQTAQHKYKNYDFESRLALRIHTALKEAK